MVKFLYIFLVSTIIFGCSKNDENTSQGQEQNQNLPTIELAPVSEITSETAISGGNVTNNGGSAITARGVCWNTNPNPTISDSFTNDGSGLGTFTSTIINLEPDTDYFLRAYATNNLGIAYSNESSFTTGSCFYIGSIDFKTQEQLDEFGENNYCAIVNGGIGITGSVNDLSPLSSLTSVDGNIVITMTTSLNSLEGLNNVTIIGETLRLNSNDGLTNLTGLSSLTSIGFLDVTENDALVDLNGISNVINAPFGFNISRNPVLESLDGLEGLVEIRGFSLSNNPLLNNINGLSNLESMTEDTFIFDNDALQNFDGLNSLISTGKISISRNNQLNNLDGLSNLLSVNGRLSIGDNLQLIDFCGLTLLVTNDGISGDYSVQGNGYNPTIQDILDGNCSL